MCSSSSVMMVSLCLLLCLPPCLSSDETVTVKPGEDVTLPCRGPAGANITLLKWTKPDLQSEDYVFFYRENRLYEKYQLQSYRGRVKLKDPEMKDGDVSVVLKNVNTNDAGRYQCIVVTGSEPKFIRDFNLEVAVSGDTVEQTGDKKGGDKEGGDKGGDKDLQIGLGVGLPLAALLVGGVVGGSIFYRKHRKPTEQSSPEVRYTAAGTGQSADHV